MRRVCEPCGTYKIDGSTFLPSSSTGGSDGEPCNGLAASAAADKLPLSAGQNRTGVNIALNAGGTISGTAFKSDGTTAATNVTVDVYTTSGGRLARTSSDFAADTYSLANLPASGTGSIVCFDGRDASFASANYSPRCWQDQHWNGSA